MEMPIDVRGDNELGIRRIRNGDESDLKLWDPADGWSCQHLAAQNNSIVSPRRSSPPQTCILKISCSIIYLKKIKIWINY